ncbi:MAG: glycosyltransferase [Elusimicrobia bacterium]|nr:glycosyltransferase [Elusimicrobiota bacterium]
MKKSKKKKKILFVINSIEKGGAERQMLYILQHIDRSLFIPHLIIFKKTGREKELLPEDVPYTLCPLYGGFFSKIYGLFLYIYKAISFRPDFILSYLWKTNLLSIFIGKITFKKVIISERTHLSIHLNEYKLNYFWKKLIRIIYPLSYRIISVSKDTEKDLINNFGIKENKTITIPNGLDIEKTKKLANKKRPLNEKYIFSCGRLSVEKNYELLIRAVAQLPNLSLVIAGEGPLKEKLLQEAEEQNLKLILPGHLTNPFVWMKHAEIFSLTSFYEGFPNVVLEAMAVEVPVVCLDFPGGTNELIEHNYSGIIVKERDAKKLAEEFKRLLEDKKLRDKISQQASEKIKEFSIEKTVLQYKKILSSNF